jgi:lysine-arginine-ornithine-binding protein
MGLFAVQAFAQVPATIRFGTDPTYAPFESKLPNGEIVGFEIDLAKAICAKIGAKCEFVETDFDTIIPALLAKKFDAILSGMSVNEARKKQISFTNKLFHGPSFLIAKKGSGLKPTPESLRGKTVGMQQGTVYETYAKKYWAPNGVTINTYKSSDLVREDLMAGRLDAMVDDPYVTEQNFFNTPQGKDFALVQPALSDPVIFGYGAAIGVRKEDTALLQKLNDAIAQIRKDGTYNKVAKKYFTFDIYGD